MGGHLVAVPALHCTALQGCHRQGQIDVKTCTHAPMIGGLHADLGQEAQDAIPSLQNHCDIELDAADHVSMWRPEACTMCWGPAPLNWRVPHQVEVGVPFRVWWGKGNHGQPGVHGPQRGAETPFSPASTTRRARRDASTALPRAAPATGIAPTPPRPSRAAPCVPSAAPGPRPAPLAPLGPPTAP